MAVPPAVSVTEAIVVGLLAQVVLVPHSYIVMVGLPEQVKLEAETIILSTVEATGMSANAVLTLLTTAASPGWKVTVFSALLIAVVLEKASPLPRVTALAAAAEPVGFPSRDVAGTA